MTNENVLKTDIFAFGMLIYETAGGANPFLSPTLRETYKKNAHGIIDAHETSRLSVELQDLLKRLTERDPRNRCSIFDAAGHPWFQADSVSWEIFVQESRLRHG
jgi:serine/threonine protein kinase